MILTAANFRRRALPHLSDASEDATLQDCLEAAESALASLLNWPIPDNGVEPNFTSATYTLYLSGDGTNTLQIPVRASGVTSIHQDSEWNYLTASLVPSADYVLDPKQNHQIILKPTSATGVFLEGERVVKVVCVAGWAQGSAPANIEQAVIMLASLLYKEERPNNRAQSLTGKKSGSRTIAVSTIPDKCKELLSEAQTRFSYL